MIHFETIRITCSTFVPGWPHRHGSDQIVSWFKQSGKPPAPAAQPSKADYA
jgi:hypothetical protein